MNHSNEEPITAPDVRNGIPGARGAGAPVVCHMCMHINPPGSTECVMCGNDLPSDLIVLQRAVKKRRVSLGLPEEEKAEAPKATVASPAIVQTASDAAPENEMPLFDNGETLPDNAATASPAPEAAEPEIPYTVPVFDDDDDDESYDGKHADEPHAIAAPVVAPAVPAEVPAPVAEPAPIAEEPAKAEVPAETPSASVPAEKQEDTAPEQTVAATDNDAAEAEDGERDLEDILLENEDTEEPAEEVAAPSKEPETPAGPSEKDLKTLKRIEAGKSFAYYLPDEIYTEEKDDTPSDRKEELPLNAARLLRRDKVNEILRELSDSYYDLYRYTLKTDAEKEQYTAVLLVREQEQLEAELRFLVADARTKKVVLSDTDALYNYMLRRCTTGYALAKDFRKKNDLFLREVSRVVEEHKRRKPKKIPPYVTLEPTEEEKKKQKEGF